MTSLELSRLEPGDIVQHASGPRLFIVTAAFGTRATAVATVDLTNPIEWNIVARIQPEPAPEPPGRQCDSCLKHFPDDELVPPDESGVVYCRACEDAWQAQQ
jgi:NMD protein affecting ribosome stability and mRNA decay